jgi:putative membrane-bound dehydrogenase-like protein
MILPFLRVPLFLLSAAAASSSAQTLAAPRPPIVNDPTLKIELLATVPDIEAPTTVCGAPDGSFYVGNDPRDGRLSTKNPVNTIVRFGPYESPDLIRNPDGQLAPPGFHRKRTVFADKIYSPAGSAWHDGYLYVLHDPLLTRFKDTDGDGVADVREDLVTNLGIPPNEGLNDHVVSGFTLGMDGFWYISVGDRGIYQAKSARDGSTISMQGGGIARCRTDGTQLEVFSTGTRNHLQVNLDAEDNAFTRDNTDDGNGWWTRLTHHIEGGYYGYPYDYRKAPNYGVTQPSEQTLNAIKQHGGSIDLEATLSDGRKVGGLFPIHDAPKPQTNETFLPAMADFGGGSPTGGLCYLSDGLPEKYRGKHFFSEWGKAGIFVTEVARDGATYRLVSDTKLIEPDKGGDFRPMQISVAADGSLLIADWGYGGWKSPKVAGAIWRLSWPEAKPAPRLADESKATVEELLAALGHPDRDQRLRAGNSLVERGQDVVQRVRAIVGEASAPQVQRIHAMWVLDGIAEAILKVAFRSPGPRDDLWRAAQASFVPALAGARDADAAIRIQAARIYGNRRFPYAGVRSDQGVHLIQELLKDGDAAVRLAAARSFAWSPGAADKSLLPLLTDSDPWVRFGVRDAIPRQGEWISFQELEPLLEEDKNAAFETAWLAITGFFNTSDNGNGTLTGYSALDVLQRCAKSSRSSVRARAVAALGRIAYKPKPYDGHWWGTQPVKNPPPLNSVPWAGTPQALAALMAALSDPDAGVRLAAAKAFTLFILPVETPAATGAGKGAARSAPSGPEALPDPFSRNVVGALARAETTFSTPVGAFLAPRKQLFWGLSAALSTPVSAFSESCQRLSGPLSSSFSIPVSAFFTPCQHLLTPCQSMTAAEKGTYSPQKAVAEAQRGISQPEEPVLMLKVASLAGQKETVHGIGGILLTQSTPSPGADGLAAGLEAATAARKGLRNRLTAETDAAVRRQIIEALGVQKDPQAMELFREIALGDPDMAFRETAIAAVVNIGGDDAKKVIAQLADAELSPAATRKIITAAGELKVLAAAPALIAHLKDADAGHRELAARALQQLGPKSNAGPALIEAMADKDGKVQAAAVDALGSFRERSALPGIIALLEKKKHLRETTGALVLMPDESAIPVLVETLRDKNTTFRRNAIKALKTMREKAWPQVEALLASGRMPEELVPEIRHAFESGAITQWKMVGVFENVWEAVHPPEKEVLALRTVTTENPTGNVQIHQDTAALAKVLQTKYHNAEGKDVGWSDVAADAEVGRVDLGQVFKTTAMVCAYAFTEIDAPEAAEAKLFTSADDELGIWLNGQQVLNLPGSHGYQPDQNETLLPLKAGKNALFVKIGNKAGTWVFHARMPGFENGKFIKSKEPTPEEKQKAFALAAKPDGTFINAGNAKNGEKLFFDQAAAMGGICATCHAVGAKGGLIGPALTTVGLNYKRADLITSLHEPSKTIALGFEQVMLETTGGETLVGSLRAESAEAFTIVDAAGQSKAVKKTEVKKKTDLHLSLMPAGLTLGLKPQDFADLLAYLESLKG